MRECQKRAQKKWNSANMDKIREYGRNYYHRHKSEVKARNLINQKKRKMNKILITVSEYYGISIDDLKGGSRKVDIVNARHVFFYMAYVVCGETLMGIGAFFNAHFTSVLHGKNKISNEIPFYTSLKNDISELTERIVIN